MPVRTNLLASTASAAFPAIPCDPSQNELKNSTGRSPIFCWPFLRFRRRPQVSFARKMYLKSVQDYRQFVVGHFCGSACYRSSVSPTKCAYNQHRTIVNFLFGVFAVPLPTACRFQPQNVFNISTGLSPICCSAFLRFRMLPQVSFSSKMFLKSAQDARQFFVGRFCGSARYRRSVSRPKCA